MKKRNLTLSMVVCILIVTLLAPISGAAAGPIDTTKDASLTLLFHDGETAISSAAFDLYYVADVSADGEFTLAGDYAAYPVSLEDMDNVSMKALANTLVGYTLRDQLVPLDSGVTDQYGALKFPQKQERLNVGLYLVIGHNHAQGEYTYIPDPFLVCLPTLDLTLDQWFENVTANVKYIVTDGRDQDKVDHF